MDDGKKSRPPPAALKPLPKACPLPFLVMKGKTSPSTRTTSGDYGRFWERTEHKSSGFTPTQNGSRSRLRVLGFGHCCSCFGSAATRTDPMQLHPVRWYAPFQPPAPSTGRFRRFVSTSQSHLAKLPTLPECRSHAVRFQIPSFPKRNDTTYSCALPAKPTRIPLLYRNQKIWDCSNLRWLSSSAQPPCGVFVSL